MVVGLTFEAHERCATRGALDRELPLPRALRPLREHRAHDLGDHIAGLAHDHGVALAHVFARDLVLVVQRGETDGRSADEHRLELRERRGPAGAADAHEDAAQQRRLLLGRELERDRPARRAARGAHLVALAQVVDLDDRAIDLVPQRVTLLEHPLAERVHGVDAVELRDLRVHRHAELREPRQRLVVRPETRAAVLHAELIREEGEIARCGDARVFLAQAAGRGVARVREQPIARLTLSPVELRERRQRHEHLAAHLQPSGRRSAEQPLRDGADRGEVGRHVFTGHAVAAGRTDRQATVFVEQRDGETVELRLTDERDRAGHELDDAVVPGDELVTAERVVERQHRHRVGDGRERCRGRAARSLRRRVGREQLGMGGFELAQLTEQRVVLGVGDLGRRRGSTARRGTRSATAARRHARSVWVQPWWSEATEPV